MNDEEKPVENSQTTPVTEGEVDTAADNSTAATNETLDAQYAEDRAAYAAVGIDLDTIAQPQSAAESTNEAAQATASQEAAIAESAAAIEALVAANELVKAQLEDFKTQYARLAADCDNFRKRTQKEKEDLEVQVKCATLKELLPVIDNFERARAHIKPQPDSEAMNVHKSYQSVYKQMVDCLKRIGVSPMRPEGEPFDPNLHEAVMSEATDQYPEGAVMEELMRGYLLGDRVLRHAMVKVATALEPTSAETEATPDNLET